MLEYVVDISAQAKIVVVPLDEYERGQNAIAGTNDIAVMDLDPL